MDENLKQTMMNEELKRIINKIKQFPDLYPQILTFIANDMKSFQEDAKRKNDWKLREALGDAVHLLGMKRKPPHEDFVNYCIRIKRAIFPKGITEYHHQGEVNFYNKYLKEKENDEKYK